MIDLTIVIASYETCALLDACLASLVRARATHPDLAVETIVVDNGSLDRSPAMVRDSYPDVRLIALARNCGFAAAVNRGLRARRGRHVLLLNSDVEIDADLLARGVGLLDAKPGAGVLGAGLRHQNGGAQRSVHAFPGWQTELVPGCLLRWVRPRGFPRRGDVQRDGSAPDSSPREVEAVRGAVFFIRGELLEKLGLLDESYFFFLEETDYCWRVAEAGHRVLHVAGLGASHRLGASSKRRVPLATRIEFHRSLYRFLERRRGRAVVRVARVVRSLRSAAGLLVGLPMALAGAPHRRRLAERWGLLLWHLRGCSDEPRLATELRLDVERDAAVDC